jgi:DNA-binding response OmpR family regulator
VKSDKLIWILEDDPSAVFVYEDILKLRYQLKVFYELKPFIDAIKIAKPLPDILISDLRLGEESFLDFLTSDESINYLKMPFIVVSSIDDIDILRLCFDEGAVDYLTKPFVKTELLVKIERLLKQQSLAQESAQNSLAQGEIILDPYMQTLKRLPDSAIKLTRKEVQIYSLLIQAELKGETINRQDLTKELWGDTNVSAKSLDVHLFHLRKKLRLLNIEIEHKNGKGYRLKIKQECQYE